jgi:hypothetical protein
MNVKTVLGLMVLGFAAALSFATPSDAAMPVGPGGLAAAPVIPVAGGCGPGFHRGPLGGCVRNRGVVVVQPPVVVAPPAIVVRPPIVVAPPVVVAPRVCPLGTHLGPAGRRCIPN